MAALMTFIPTVISGLAIFFFMPSGMRRGGYQEFWGIQKNVWMNIHDWTGILFIIFVFIHLLLHWRWLMAMTRNISKKEEKEE